MLDDEITALTLSSFLYTNLAIRISSHCSITYGYTCVLKSQLLEQNVNYTTSMDCKEDNGSKATSRTKMFLPPKLPQTMSDTKKKG